MILLKRLIVTIDGPSGAGKSTVARALADRLGYAYLDTGAMYRAVAYAYLGEHAEQEMANFLETLDLVFSFEGSVKVLLNGVDVSSRIRTSENSLAASRLSQDPRVRKYCTDLQRRLAEPGGVVVEGRDTGSVVFPDADRKFFLDANVEERAKRRHSEGSLSQTANNETVEKVRIEIEKRDREDSERSLAPLVRPQGAIYVDTTDKSIDEVVEILAEDIEKIRSF